MPSYGGGEEGSLFQPKLNRDLGGGGVVWSASQKCRACVRSVARVYAPLPASPRPTLTRASTPKRTRTHAQTDTHTLSLSCFLDTRTSGSAQMLRAWFPLTHTRS